MGWLEGLISGYTGRHREIEQEKLAQATAANERESALFTTILQHSTDPKLRSMAATGLLTASQGPKRRSGFLGYLGDLEANPLTARIQQFLQTPQPYEEDVVTPGLPSKQALPTAVPPGPGSAALPTTQTTTPGAPPPSPTQPIPGATPPPTVPMQQGAPPAPPTAAAAGPTVGRAAAPPAFPTMSEPRNVAGPRVGNVEHQTVMRLPNLFPSAAEQLTAQAKAKVTGPIEGYTEMYLQADPNISLIEARQKAAQLVEQDTIGANALGAYVKGPIEPDAASPTGFSQVFYMRGDPTVQHKMPVVAPGSTSARAANPTELLASSMYGQPGENGKQTLERLQRTDPDALGNVMKRARFEIANRPMNEGQRFQAISTLQDDWRTFTAPYQTQLGQMRRMRGAMQLARSDQKYVPAASEAILVSFQRMLDPDSVVREAEARRPGSMQSWLTRIQGAINDITIGGAGIPLDQLQTYLDLAELINGDVEQMLASERARIEARGREFNLGPLNLIGFEPRGGGGGAPPPPPNPNATAPPVGGGVTLDTPIRVGPDGRYIVGQ